MPPGYSIRRPRRADIDALERFAAETIPHSRPGSIARRWWWSADPPGCWVAVHDATDEIAALCGERRGSLLAGGTAISAAGICDWYVSPRHQGLGLGRLLVERIRAESPALYATSISNSAAAGFSRLGWSRPTKLPVLIGQSAVVAALGWIGGGPTVQSYSVTVDEGPWCAVDDIWAASAGPLPVMVPRDSGFVRAHLALAPARAYRLAMASVAGRVAGYALYRALAAGSVRRFPFARVGLLVDFWTAGDDRAATLRALAARAATDCAASGAVALVTLATQSWAADSLVRLGFASPRTPLVGHAVSRLSSLAMHNGGAGSTGFDGWHLTFADGDTDLLLGAT